MREFVIDENADKAFVMGYEVAIPDAAKWFPIYLGEGSTIDDWCRDSKVLENGREKFFNELGE